MPLASSSERLEACLPYIFEGEGGYTKNPKDPGNWTGGKVGKGVLKGTKYGIAANSFPNLDIVNLTKAQAADIYRAKYWTTAGCDTLPAGVDLPIFDVSVNSGPGRATAFRKATATIANAVDRIKAISAKRRAFYQGLKTFKTFGKGWMSRVAKIEAAALKMALKAQGASPVAVAAQLKAEAGISKKKETQGQAVAASTVAAPTAAVTAAPASLDWVSIGIGVALVAVCLIIAIHFIRAHHERAQAFVAEAEVV